MLNYIRKANKERLFFIILILLSIFATSSVYLFKFNGPPIRSDGIGYYAYLPAVFIHKDLSMKSLMGERAAKYNEPTPDSWAGIIKQENGNYLDKYTIGEAVMMLPFFLPAHILTIVFNQEVNGFTIFYQIFAAFSGVFYMIAGVFILKRFLNQYFKSRTVYLALFAIIFGTNLFHYGTYDSIFNHSYSFFLFALFIFLLPKWFENKSSKYSLILGSLSGLIVLVRPTNIIFPIILFLFFGINNKNDLLKKFKLFWVRRESMILMILIAFLIVLPQLIYWKLITGNFIAYSYQGESFNFSKPEILNVLFSVRKGVFFWSPVLLLVIPGFYLMHKKMKGWFLPIFSFLIVNLIIIASWWAWSYGGSFGHRGFVESYTLLSIPLALIIERILDGKKKYLKVFLIILIGFLIALNLFTMYKYWDHKIPVDGTDLEMYLKIFTN